MSFKSDLAFGHKYEDIFIEKVLKNPPNLERPAGKFSGYDFALGDERYEVKADRQTHKTGNFCIESHCGGKPSGISITQATRYVYFVVYPDGWYDIYNIPKDDILKMIIAQKHERTMWGGDNKKSHFYLINKYLFEKYKIYVRAKPLADETKPDDETLFCDTPAGGKEDSSL